LIFDTQYHTTSDIPRFDKLTETKNGRLKYAEWNYGPMDFLFFSPRMEMEFSSKWMNKLRIITSYQRVKESRIWRKFDKDIRNYRKEKVDVFTFNADASAKLSKKTKINYGVEAAYNRVRSQAYGRKLVVSGHEIIDETGEYYVPTRYPNAGSYYMDFAVYSGWEHRFDNRNFLNLGIRFTQTFLSALWKDLQLVELPFQSVEISNFAITPMVRYIYSPEKWKISLSLGSGYRSPNVDDVGKIREKKGKLLVPNINLRPEYLYTSELSLQRRFFSNRLKLQGFVYHNFIVNYIDRQPYVLNGFSQINYDGDMVDIYANVNSGTARIYGFDLLAETTPSEHFSWSAGLSYIKGRKQNGDPMPSIPPLKINSNLKFKNDFYEINIYYLYYAKKPLGEYDIKGGVDNLDESPFDPRTGEYVGFPQWNIFNLSFTYYLTHNLTLNLGVENIFDVHYKRFASAVSEPGRNFKVQITGKF
jgi:hemoglobin/transferrin/lactoferrin receptor protein